MVRPDFPQSMPVSEVELLVFIMDGSGSMNETNTPDGRRKADHLYDIVKGVIERLQKSTKSDAFRVSFIYFSDGVKIEEKDGLKYFLLSDALQLLKNPLDVTGGGSTAIADALAAVKEILKEFSADEGLPDDKKATIFLFTDGEENVRTKNDVVNEAEDLKSLSLSPNIATISFGIDADGDLLRTIASKPSERQIKHLEISNLESEIDMNYLFIEGHTGDNEITKRKIETIRNFVEVLSMTRD